MNTLTIMVVMVGIAVYLYGVHLAEHELRLVWNGYVYDVDPSTGKTIRSEAFDLRDPEDMKYAWSLFSFVLYVPMRLYRRNQEREQCEQTHG